jgi:hypothetical protein
MPTTNDRSRWLLSVLQNVYTHICSTIGMLSMSQRMWRSNLPHTGNNGTEQAGQTGLQGQAFHVYL